MGDTRKLAAWVCKEEARGLICLQFEESATAPAAHHPHRVSISADHPGQSSFALLVSWAMHVRTNLRQADLTLPNQRPDR
uniref:Uncharacterized protein n=1 Tax=Salix viminalis TaxID=40686 RepID=A0A6N2KZ30_SALVM